MKKKGDLPSAPTAGCRREPSGGKGSFRSCATRPLPPVRGSGALPALRIMAKIRPIFSWPTSPRTGGNSVLNEREARNGG